MVYNASNELMSHQLVTLHPLIINLYQLIFFRLIGDNYVLPSEKKNRG